MENVFPEQFAPNDECVKSIWENGIFVFDTNILLNLYRHSVQTRDQLFDVMERIKDRVFLPHQVGLEFFRNREVTIAEQTNAFEKGRSLLRQIPLNFQKQLTRHPSIPIEKISQLLSNAVNECIEFIDDSQPASGTDYLRNSDPVLSRLNGIFHDSAQASMTEPELENARAFVQERFERKLAPCFTNAKSETNIHQGDGFVWYQIMEHARGLKKPIVFVTADTIENWWRMTKIGNHDRAIGPHFELVKDIRKNAGAHFLMYTQDDFLKAADKYLQTSTTPEAVEESRQLRESDADSITAKSTDPESGEMSTRADMRQRALDPNEIAKVRAAATRAVQRHKDFADRASLKADPSVLASMQLFERELKERERVLDDAKLAYLKTDPNVLASMQLFEREFIDRAWMAEETALANLKADPIVLASMPAFEREFIDRARMADETARAHRKGDPSVLASMSAFAREFKERERMLDDGDQTLQPRQDSQQLDSDSPEAR